MEGTCVRYLLSSLHRNVILAWALLLSISLIANGPKSTGISASDTLKRVSISTLQLAIVGSIVAKNKTSSVVLLKYLSTSEIKAHRVGNVLFSKYTLLDITENSITLQTYEQNHVTLIVAYMDKFFRDLQKASPKAPPQPAGLTDSYKEDGFERNQGEIHMTEAYKNNLLSPQNLTATLMQASADPVIKNGQVVGFQLDLIEPESLYAKSGLVNGDIITEINGVPLNDAAAAVRLMQSLRSAKSVSLSFMRGGTVIPVTIGVQ